MCLANTLQHHVGRSEENVIQQMINSGQESQGRQSQDLNEKRHRVALGRFYVNKNIWFVFNGIIQCWKFDL